MRRNAKFAVIVSLEMVKHIISCDNVCRDVTQKPKALSWAYINKLHILEFDGLWQSEVTVIYIVLRNIMNAYWSALIFRPS